LTSRYRHKLDYSEESIEAAAAGLESLRARLRSLGPPPADGPLAAPQALRAEASGDRPEGIASDAAGHGASDTPDIVDRAHAPAVPLSEAGRELHERFIAALDEDLDTSTAVAVARETLRAPIPDDEKRWLLLDFDFVLGLDLDGVWEGPAAEDGIPAKIQERLDARTAARAARDYATSDAIRDELAASGWDVLDGPEGSTARPKVGAR
jgi:cysteinyl-tRNA synthetase